MTNETTASEREAFDQFAAANAGTLFTGTVTANQAPFYMAIWRAACRWQAARAALPAPADPSGHEPGVRPTPAPGQCPQCGEYSMSARAAQGLYGTMVQQAQPSPVEGPRIPGRVLTYWHAYGDARADDDGSSPLRLSEAIKSTRSWAAAIASVPQAAPADQPPSQEPQGSSGSLSESGVEAMTQDAASASERLPELLRWCYSKLHYRSFDSMEDALVLDEIKLLLEHGKGAQA